MDKIKKSAIEEQRQMLIVGEDWYINLLEECKTHLVESEFSFRWALIEGRHGLGKIIADSCKEHKILAQSLIIQLSMDLEYSERTLYYCLEFYQKFPELLSAPFKKNISWREIIDKHLTEHPGSRSAKKEERKLLRQLAEPKKEAVQIYLDYIRDSKCVVCSKGKNEVIVDPHHWPKTSGAGAKAWRAIPVCRECHSMVQNEPHILTEGTNMENITTFLYDTILNLINIKEATSE